ncbi:MULTISPECIES: terpene synthase family protein [Streptomyces]|uniref:Terpene synthase n=2 Tax=Streptomyces TaxID=1883 RepID=A0ABV9J5S0_9ACTN
MTTYTTLWTPYDPPRPALPFPSLRSAHAAGFEDDALQWATQRGLVSGGNDEAYWREVGLGELSARAYPHAEASTGLLLTCWIGWTACVERHFDEPATPAPRELLALAKSLVGRGEPLRVRHPLAAALSDLWRDTSRLMPPHWSRHLAVNLAGYLHACAAESQEHGSDPGHVGVEDFFEQRRLTVGSYVYCDLVELSVGFAVPDGLYRSEIFRRMRQVFNDLTSLVNDLASVPKELAVGDMRHNLVLLTHQREAIPVARAACQVAARIEELAGTFTALKEQLEAEACRQALAAGDREGLRCCVEAMEAFIAGEQRWHELSVRYTQASEPPATPRRDCDARS